MSKLRVASALALLLFVFAVASVSAQVPYVQAYFCPTKQSENCKGFGVQSELCIYTHNFPVTYNTLEFAVSYPAAVTWVPKEEPV